jgi:hypothetical protein
VARYGLKIILMEKEPHFPLVYRLLIELPII